jgi:hypothetical protein
MLIIDFNMSARMIIGYDSWLRSLEVVVLSSLHIAVDKFFVSSMHSIGYFICIQSADYWPWI